MALFQKLALFGSFHTIKLTSQLSRISKAKRCQNVLKSRTFRNKNKSTFKIFHFFALVKFEQGIYDLILEVVDYVRRLF
jgi:flagellar biosynthesis protein FlhB